MSALDSGFFFAESENTPMHVGSVAVFEGPAPTYGDVVRLLLSKLPVVPRYRQRVREDRKSTRLNSSHPSISYAVFCLKKKNRPAKVVVSYVQPILHNTSVTTNALQRGCIT